MSDPSKMHKEPEYDIIAEGDMAPWLVLAMTAYDQLGTVGHWREIVVESVPTLQFSRLAGAEWTVLPCAADPSMVAAIARNWLESVERQERPVTDGSLNAGWRLTSRGPAFGSITVQPAWIRYSK